MVLITFICHSSTLATEKKATVEFLDFGEITNLYKEWTITVNGKIDGSSITTNSISIKDEQGETIPISLKVQNNQITVSPRKPYKNLATYTLFISNNIRNIHNVPLSKEHKVMFSTNAIENPENYTVPRENMDKISPLNKEDYKGQALVTLSYDDGYRNWYDSVLPLHSKYNMPGTFNIISEKVYSGNEDYMVSSQLWVAYDLGIEIASHTHTHSFLTQKTDAEIHQEFFTSKLILEDIVGEVSTLAVPYSSYDERVREIAMQYFDGVRVLSWEANTLDSYDPYWLKSLAVVNTMEFSTIKQWIDEAVEENSWVIIMLHGITKDRSEEYETTPEILEQIMQYIHELGPENILPVNTKDGIQLMNDGDFKNEEAHLKKDRATWVWNPWMLLEDEDEAINFLVDQHINKIYLQIDYDISLEVYRSFIEKTASKGIQTYALAGEEYWVSSKSVGYINELLDWLNMYQKAATSSQQFLGMHLDIEPYLNSSWETNQEGLIEIYQTLIQEGKTWAKNWDVPFEVDIPFWFDEIQYDNEDGKGNLAEWVIQHTDSVTIMAYRDNAPMIIEIVTDEIEYAEKYGKAIVIGVETMRSEEIETVSFFEEGTEVMNEELNKVIQHYRQSKAFNGIAIHHFESWKELFEQFDTID